MLPIGGIASAAPVQYNTPIWEIRLHIGSLTPLLQNGIPPQIARSYQINPRLLYPRRSHRQHTQDRADCIVGSVVLRAGQPVAQRDQHGHAATARRACGTHALTAVPSCHTTGTVRRLYCIEANTFSISTTKRLLCDHSRHCSTSPSCTARS